MLIHAFSLSASHFLSGQSRSLSGRHVSTGFKDPVNRGLPEARMAGATVCFTSGQQPIRLVHLFELRHSGFSPLCPWQILVVVVFLGPCSVRFVSLLDVEAHIWLGDLHFALCGLCLLFFVLLICQPVSM